MSDGRGTGAGGARSEPRKQGDPRPPGTARRAQPSSHSSHRTAARDLSAVLWVLNGTATRFCLVLRVPSSTRALSFIAIIPL